MQSSMAEPCPRPSAIPSRAQEQQADAKKEQMKMFWGSLAKKPAPAAASSTADGRSPSATADGRAEGASAAAPAAAAPGGATAAGGDSALQRFAGWQVKVRGI